MAKPKGLDRLLRQMAALPLEVRKAAAVGVEDRAKTLAVKIATAAPVHTGHLRDSIEAKPAEATDTRARSPDGQALAAATAEAGLRWKVISSDFKSRFVEFGTRASPAGRSQDAKGKTRTNKAAHHATRAQPFFWPTVRAQKRPGVSRLSRNLNKAVKVIAAKT